MEETKTGLLDIILLLIKGKKFIIIFTLIASIYAIIYTLVVDEKWTSEFTVFPLTTQEPFSASLDFMAGMGFGGGQNARAINFKNSAVLKSRSISEEVIEKFDLINYFNITEDDPTRAMSDAVTKLQQGLLSVLINNEINMLSVRITTTDRYFSKARLGNI